jgi:hypothetical protein
MHTFSIIFNRHAGRYPPRTSGFRDEYYIHELCKGETSYDPDLYNKYKPKKFYILTRIAFFIVFLYLCKRQKKVVSDYEKKIRQQEIVEGKKV